MKSYHLLLTLVLLNMSCSKELLNNCDSKSGALLLPKSSFSIVKNGQTITLINNSENAESYEWDFDNGIKSNEKSPSEITYNANRTYTIKLTAKRCGGEKTNVSSKTVTIDCPEIPTPTITSNKTLTFCEGSNIILTATCPSGNTSLWSGSTASTIQVNTNGTYLAYCKNTVSGCLSKPSEQKIVVSIAPQKPTIINNLNKTDFCTTIDASLRLSASCSSGTISWSNGATTSSIAITSAGTYFAQCSNNDCPTAKSDDVVIKITPKPSAPTITTADKQCSGENFTLTANGCTGGSLKWFSGSSVLNSTTQSITVAQTFASSCTINNCDSDKSASKIISVIPLADITTELPTVATVALVRYNITLKGTLDFNSTSIGSVDEYGFVWAFGTGTLPRISETAPTNSTDGIINLGVKTQTNTSVTFPFSHSLNDQTSKNFRYQAYIKRCNGKVEYGKTVTIQ